MGSDYNGRLANVGISVSPDGVFRNVLGRVLTPAEAASCAGIAESDLTSIEECLADYSATVRLREMSKFMFSPKDSR
jgi:hypothetical protein